MGLPEPTRNHAGVRLDALLVNRMSKMEVGFWAINREEDLPRDGESLEKALQLLDRRALGAQQSAAQEQKAFMSAPLAAVDGSSTTTELAYALVSAEIESRRLRDLCELKGRAIKLQQDRKQRLARLTRLKSG